MTSIQWRKAQLGQFQGSLTQEIVPLAGQFQGSLTQEIVPLALFSSTVIRQALSQGMRVFARVYIVIHPFLYGPYFAWLAREARGGSDSVCVGGFITRIHGVYHHQISSFTTSFTRRYI